MYYVCLDVDTTASLSFGASEKPKELVTCRNAAMFGCCLPKSLVDLKIFDLAPYKSKSSLTEENVCISKSEMIHQTDINNKKVLCSACNEMINVGAAGPNALKIHQGKEKCN